MTARRSQLLDALLLGLVLGTVIAAVALGFGRYLLVGVVALAGVALLTWLVVFVHDLVIEARRKATR